MNGRDDDGMNGESTSSETASSEFPNIDYPDRSEKEAFDPYQTVVHLSDYASLMASEERKNSTRKTTPKGTAKDPADAQAEVPDSEMAARLMRSVTFDEEAAIERARNKKWLVYGVIPHGDVGFIYGNPGSYKSFLAVDIASHVASARQWNGIDVDLPGAVLYVAGEGAAELHIRKKAWRIATGGDNAALTILECGVRINDVKERAELKALIREVERITGNRHVLIVLDTFSKCFSGKENEADDMRTFIAGCEDLRDTFGGCTVLFVGHTGKGDKTAMRGSSVAGADCGFSYRITRGQKKLYAEMHCDKLKDSTEPDDMAFKFEVWETGDKSQKGVPLTSLVPTMTALLERNDDEAGERLGRAEGVGLKPSAATGNKSKLIGILKNRVRMNGGDPVPRMMIREDMMIMFRQNEGMSESGAKSAWKRVWDECALDGTIIVCEGDQWLLREGL